MAMHNNGTFNGTLNEESEQSVRRLRVPKFIKKIGAAAGISTAVLLSACVNEAPNNQYEVAGDEDPGNGGDPLGIGDTAVIAEQTPSEVNDNSTPVENEVNTNDNNNVDRSGDGWTLSGETLTVAGIDVDVSKVLGLSGPAEEHHEHIFSSLQRQLEFTQQNRPNETITEVWVESSGARLTEFGFTMTGYDAPGNMLIQY